MVIIQADQLHELMCEAAEETGTKLGVATTVKLAYNLVTETEQVQDLRHADVEENDVQRTWTMLANGEARLQERKLHTGMLKDLAHSFRTSISVNKLCATDPAMCEYLLYVLLDTCWRAGKRVHLPSGTRKQENSPE